ncbi:MAG: sugar phosphate isomerase/epimerase [Oscillospiraceae bacterium]|jgi:sugar phosphate isomerase/epimerase|nr:sugar phosphate isomerase/epimerase [Oscillospiraceae bacterium]
MLAIYHYFGYDLPLRERFEMIKAAGFDAVGLFRDEWFGWTAHRTYADLARAVGLQVTDGHAPFDRDYDFVNALWLDNLDGETTFEVYARAIAECGEDGVENLIVHPCEDEDTEPPPPCDLGIERIKRLIEMAERANVTLAFENLSRLDYLSYIFGRVSSPKLGFCYDAGHFNLRASEPKLDLLSLFGEKLTALHLHDNDGSDDQHKIPFEGAINWREQMTKIASTGFSGATTLECTTGSPGSAGSNDSRSPE